MKLYSLFLIFLLGTLFLVPESYGQNSGLERLQKKFSAAKSITISFKQVNSKSGGTGVLTYKKENMVHLDQKNLLVVSDGKTVWNYNKVQKKVIISNYTQADGSLLSLPRIINEYPAQCTVTENKAGTSSIITLVPKSKKLGFERAEIRTGKNDNIEQISVTANGNKITFDFTSTQWDAKVDDDIFTFTAPEGVKVIDLR